MESILSRYRNSIVLVALVFGQMIVLATQVKRADPSNPAGDEVRLLRVWVMRGMTPFGKMLNFTGQRTRDYWHIYLSAGNALRENEQLQREVNDLRADRVRLYQEAKRTQDLERLFNFKEQYVAKTVPAQVIYSSGTEASHILYIDKGKQDGLSPELPVITPDGIVGKVREVYPHSSQVLLLNDPQSGIGVMLEKTRRQGIMKGSVSGRLEIHYIISDEQVEPGEKVYTSGGDRIFPKGLEVGQVMAVTNDGERDGFQIIRVKPNANLFRLEELLVVTQVAQRTPTEEQQLTPAQVLAGRLPGIDAAKVETEPKVDADGKVITPPPVKPAKALAPDRFSPPEDRGSRLAKAPVFPADGAVGAAPKPKPQVAHVKTTPDTATEAPQE